MALDDVTLTIVLNDVAVRTPPAPLPPIAEPDAIEKALSDGYQYASSKGDVDPAPEVARTVSKAQLQALVPALSRLQDRDHVARVRLAFIKRVMALQG